MRRSLVILIAALSLALIAVSALADPWQRPNLVKQSFRHREWNLGLGSGPAWFSATHDDGYFYADGDASEDADIFPTGAAWIGYGVARDLVLGVEAQYLPATFEGDEGEEDWSVLLSTLALRWYPGAMGLSIKGGLGFGLVSAELDDKAGGAAPLEDKLDKSPFTLGAGVGYEWRLPIQGHAVTFGPQVDYHYLRLSGEHTASVISLKLQLQWYSSRRGMDQYFGGKGD
jgi:hypothetical protein